MTAFLVCVSLRSTGAAAFGDDYAGVQHSRAGVSRGLHVRERLWTPDSEL